jgi:type VI secretion system protein ImpJ
MKMQRVVWYEGMKLDPHHFQQADRYNQYYINSRIDFINSNFWGFKLIQIDAAAIAGGLFGLTNCSGIMQDGIVFNMPVNDPLPKVRNFEEFFSATSEKLDVYLAIQVENNAGSNCQLNESSVGNSSRFILQNIDLLDYNTGSNLRSIGLGKPNFQYKFGEESLESYSSIKIGELIRSSDGKYYFDQNFIPTLLDISTSNALMQHSRNVLGAIISKSKELRNQASIKKPDLSMIQVEILLMLQTVNSFIHLLNYYISSGSIHPENLYMLFLNIAGQLSTFSNLGVRISELPIYDHKHLTEIFNQVVNEINMILNIQKTVERKDIIIPLRRQAETLFVGQLSPAHLSAEFYIAVTGEMAEKKIIADLPKNIKISAYEEIFAVHQAGIQGLTVEYIARPPAGVSINEKAHYFKINKEGRFWDKISSKSNIAFFIAAEFKQLQMELVLLTS